MERVRVRIVRKKWLRAVGWEVSPGVERRVFKVGPKRNDLVSDDGPYGTETSPSCLLSEEGNMCCLGFICDKLLQPLLSAKTRRTLLLGEATPNTLRVRVQDTHLLTKQQKAVVCKVLKRLTGDAVATAMNRNDDSSSELLGITPYARRKRLSQLEVELQNLFKPLGIDLSFVD